MFLPVQQSWQKVNTIQPLIQFWECGVCGMCDDGNNCRKEVGNMNKAVERSAFSEKIWSVEKAWRAYPALVDGRLR